MNQFNTLILWVWLLSVSLLIPITLPVGGLRKTLIEHREDSSSSPIIALNEFNLLSSISENPLILASVRPGTPVNVLKEWNSSETGQWLLVKVLIDSSSQIFHKRGWVKIGLS